MNNLRVLKISVSLFAVLLLSSLIGCQKFLKQQQRAEQPADEEKVSPLTKVEKVFALAKGFANGSKTIADLKSEFDTLTAEELNELAEKQDGAHRFVNLMAMGSASSDSIGVIQKTLNAPAPSTTGKDKILGKSLVKELLSSRRPSGEVNAERINLLGVILERFPEQINNLKKTDGAFDVKSFNEVIASLDSAQVEPIVAALNNDNFNEWFTWATDVKNKAEAQPAFKMLYSKAPAEQARLRDKLLEHNSSDPDPVKRKAMIEAMIDEADAWGILASLDSDLFTLISTNAGSTFNGPLLYVLTMRAIRENSLPGAMPQNAFDDLRDYASKIKAAINDPAKYSNLATIDLWGSTPKKTILDALKDALAPAYKNYANYYLDLAEPKDVFAAARAPLNIVSNEILKDLYDKVIGADASKANLLSQETVPAGSPDAGLRFIDLLIKRSIDAAGDSFDILNKYLNSINVAAGGGALGLAAEKAQLDDGAGHVPVKVLLRVPPRPNDDPMQKAKVVKRLLQNDDGATLAKLSPPEFKAYIESIYAKSGPGGTGAQEFKEMYNKPGLAAKREVMRNALFQRAAASATSLRTFIDQIVDPLDPWGLRAGLLVDDYELAPPGPGKKGPLLYVLALRAIAQPAAQLDDALKEYRGFSEGIRDVLGNGPFKTQATVTKFGLVPKKSILERLQEALLPKNRDNFAPYYLTLGSTEDIYRASLKPENIVSNLILKEIYDLIIGNSEVAAAKLAQEHTPGQVKFIHRLAERSADATGNSFYMLNRFLTGNYQNGETIALGTGPGAERALIDDATGGKKPLKLLLERRALNAPPHDSAQKILKLTRMLSHVTSANLPNALAGITTVELGDLSPLLLSHPAVFKKIYAFYAPNSNEAKALRNGLLAEAYKSPDATVKLIKDIMNPADIYGLYAGRITDSYKLDRKPPGGGGLPHEGTLLYVLTKGAIDENALGNSKAFYRLKDFAQAMKDNWGASIPTYNDYFSVNIEPGKGVTIKQDLENNLPAQDKPLAAAYLGSAKPQDIIDATEKSPALVSNDQLKSLYNLIIGVDPANAAVLGALKGTITNKSFIELLLERPVDTQGRSYVMLDAFLDGIYWAAEKVNPGTGGQAELAQLKKNHVVNRFPFKILTDPTRVGDDAIQKSNILIRMLNHEDGSTLDKLNAADLESLRFFAAGSAGAQAFNMLYRALKKLDLTKPLLDQDKRLKVMRSTLLKEVYNSIPNVLRFVENLTEYDKKKSLYTDIWGLNSGLEKDTWELDDPTAPGAKFTGTLIEVLTEGAIADEHINPNRARYLALRNIARNIKDTLDRGNIGKYEAKAAGAKTALTAELDATHPGFAYYYLHLDVPKGAAIPGTNPPVLDQSQIVMDTVNNVLSFDDKVLNAIYAQAIDKEAQAWALSQKTNMAGQAFIQVLISKDTKSGIINSIFDDYLKKIHAYAESKTVGTGAKAVADQIAEIDAAGKNVLYVLLDKNGGKPSTDVVPLIARAASAADPILFKGINTDLQAKALLNALYENALYKTLAKVFAELPDGQMKTLAKWCGQRTDNLEIGPMFKQELQVRAAKRQEMIDTLVETAYDKGKTDSPTNPFKEVMYMIDNDFLDDTTLKGSFFNPVPPSVKVGLSTLLFVMIDVENPAGAHLTNELVDTLKKKFRGVNPVTDWQNYLDNLINLNNTQSTLMLLMSLKPTLTLPNAKKWLKY